MTEPEKKPEFKVLEGGLNTPTVPPSAIDPVTEAVVEAQAVEYKPEPESYVRMVSGGVDKETGKPRPIENKDDLTDRQREKVVRKLVRKLPQVKFSCKETCGKCCTTPTEMLQVEWDRLINTDPGRAIMLRHEKNKVDTFVTVISPAAVKVGLRDGSCPFLNPITRACGVFEQRPFVCRAYGQHWFFRCAEGVESPEGGDVGDKLMVEYGKLAMKPYGAMDEARMGAVRVVVEEWRAKEPEKRRDLMPTYDELKEGVERNAEEARKPKQPILPADEPKAPGRILDFKKIGNTIKADMEIGGRIILPGSPDARLP